MARGGDAVDAPRGRAAAVTCRLVSATVVLSESWRYDFTSVVAHEAGHGWGHANRVDSTGDCTTADYHTMCTFVLQGSTTQRVPHWDERGHLIGVYG